jgi:hypothetical protein
VPAVTLAYRHLYKRSVPAKSGWRYELEQSVLDSIPNVELLSPSAAAVTLAPIPVRIERTVAGLKSALHIAPVILK